MDEILDEQLRYYRARAQSYDDTYDRVGAYDRGTEANQAWKAEIQRIADSLAASPLRGHVLELGCGTGHWTAQLADIAAEVSAVDGASEMIKIATRRLVNHPNVELRCEEIVRKWSPPGGSYDGFAAFFFIEHVPDTELDGLLRRVANTLRPGACVFVAEGAPQATEAPEVETRVLHDRHYRVIERRRTTHELIDAFARAGMTMTFTTTGRRFHIGQGHASSGRHPA